jgi:hypothetical protein
MKEDRFMAVYMSQGQREVMHVSAFDVSAVLELVCITGLNSLFSVSGAVIILFSARKINSAGCKREVSLRTWVGG